MITLFFPYYQCGNVGRQQEIDACLSHNVNNNKIGKIVLIIDDSSAPPVTSNKLHIIHVDARPTYKMWIDFTRELNVEGVSILCNSDIHFDDSITRLPELLNADESFLALTRYDLVEGQTTEHPNPQWSQDCWAVNAARLPEGQMLKSLDFNLGVPRCDNKVAYVFAVNGWKVFNPYANITTYHLHNTEFRTYHKKLDDTLLGGVAYIHPSTAWLEESTVDIDVWVKRGGPVANLSLNKSLERWTTEHELSKRSKEQDYSKLELTACSSQDMTQALQAGKVLFELQGYFRCIATKTDYVYINMLEPSASKKLAISGSDMFDPADPVIIALAFIPQVLAFFTAEIGTKGKDHDDVMFWQYPCSTELQALENHQQQAASTESVGYSSSVDLYVPVPWATLIDKKNVPAVFMSRLRSHIASYERLAKNAGIELRAHTVCQHIYWKRILEEAKNLGVTDLHASHKTTQDHSDSLTLHGWPLIAVNYVHEERREGLEIIPINERKLLASFVGAYMPHYLNDNRLRLEGEAKDYDSEDVFVELSNEWHFNPIVYEAQIHGKQLSDDHMRIYDERTYNYNSVLSNSKFSLCPDGAGPNTLRLWESIAVGSIPVIFSADLAILHDDDIGGKLLENCISEQPVSECLGYMANISEIELDRASNNLMQLYSSYAYRTCFT
jgi:hypothetical protein